MGRRMRSLRFGLLIFFPLMFIFFPGFVFSQTDEREGLSLIERQAAGAPVTPAILAQARLVPRFRWLGPVSSVPIGERRELILELIDWDPQRNVPTGFFQGRAPRNAILEESAPAAAGRGVYRFTISLIPLEGNRVVLESFSFQTGGINLSVPAITVPLSARPRQPEPELPVDEANEIPQIAAQVFPFPEIREEVFPFLQNEYNRIVTRVQTYWENGYRVLALAEIRRNERDSLAGPFLVSLRREMEQTLGLGFTENERWRPLRISFFTWMIIGFLIVSIAVLFFIFRIRPWYKSQRNAASWNFTPQKIFLRGNVTFRPPGGFKAIVLFVLFLGTALIVLEESMGNFSAGQIRSSGKTAVLERTQAYRVPDLKGTVNARFGEGQPVIVGERRGNWFYAESSDGRAGWVLSDFVITY